LNDQQSSVDLVIVGSVALDTIETPLERREKVLGGSVTYACIAGSFFARCGMVGVVGSDFPQEAFDLYDRVGIDTSGLKKESDGLTFAWSGVYEEDFINRRTLSTDLNVFADFQPDLPDSYRSAPYLFLGNISPDLQLRVLFQAKGAKFVAMDTMDLWINIEREQLLEAISKVNMLTLNDSESMLLTGQRNVVLAAKAILAMGPSYVAIKKGEHGALLFDKAGRIGIIPAYPVAGVEDPTGAGDSFAGGFMGFLAKSDSTDFDSVLSGLVRGSVIASFGVESFGPEALSTVSAESLSARLDSFITMLPNG